MKVVVKDGQTLMDIAVKEKGSVEAVFDIAALNGISVTEEIVAGTVLDLPASVWNRLLENYCKGNNVDPSTDLNDDDLNEIWQGGIGYMMIGEDFQIG